MPSSNMKEQLAYAGVLTNCLGLYLAMFFLLSRFFFALIRDFLQVL
jgi:hypothetical protein